MKRLVPLIAGLLLIVAGCGPNAAPAAKAPASAKPLPPDTSSLVITVVPDDEAKTKATSGLSALPPFADTDDLAKVYALIRSKHMTTDATDKELYYGAIRGMVEALHDPFSAFLDPKSAAMARQQMSGNFVGIGAQLKMEEERLTIVTPMEGSPAEKAGLKPGDIILEIDGDSTDGMAIDAAVARIRGAPDTPVKLKIARKGSSEPLEFTIVRHKIDTPSVKWKYETAHGKRMLHITVSEFADDTKKLFAQAVDDAQLANVAGIILDLRNDGGGRLDVAGYISCHWITGTPFTVLAYRDGRKEAWVCDNDTAPLAKFRTVVLVNKGSASASEITAGALQDSGRARIIGEKTFGKGCGQNVIDFPDGAQLRLVSFLWYTPKGRSIHKVGIMPDEVLKGDPDEIKKGHDVQLDRAKELLSTGK